MFFKVKKIKKRNNFYSQFEKYYRTSWNLNYNYLKKISVKDFLDNPIFCRDLYMIWFEDLKDQDYNRKYYFEDSYIYTFDKENNKKYLTLALTNIKIKVKDLNLELMCPKNTNFKEEWLIKFYSSIKEAIISTIHSKYFFYTKKDIYKRLLEFKWFGKNEIREVLPLVEKEIGAKESLYFTKEGMSRKRIVPEKFFIHLSGLEKRILACQNWEKDFPEEFTNGNYLLIQGGNKGIVFTKKGGYTTAFVEVFPEMIKDKDSYFSSFIRGEGEDIKAAEKDALHKLSKIKNCIYHDWKNKNKHSKICRKCNARKSLS